MPIDAIDVELQNYITQSRNEQNQIASDSDADAADRKAVEKKLEIRKEELKGNRVDRDISRRMTNIERRLGQVRSGSMGRDAANALAGWENNSELQGRLTEAQRGLFLEKMATHPEQAARSGEALSKLMAEPGFRKAVNTTQQVSTVHEGVVRDPSLARPAREAVRSPFMQAPRADPAVKNDFMRFAMGRSDDARLQQIGRAGALLGGMASDRLGRPAQRATMRMVQRTSGAEGPISSVDSFTKHPAVRAMPTYARTKATESLAKADGQLPVRQGFETLASSPTFRQQTAENQGRFFATIGTGRPSEYRALTDRLLGSLESPRFPARSQQVGKFLTRVAGQMQSGGAAGVDTDRALEAARQSRFPSPPGLRSTVGLSDEEASLVRRQNLSKIIQYYTQVARAYDQADAQIGQAKYYEDINRLANLQPAEHLDAEGLPESDRALVADREARLRARLEEVKGRQVAKLRGPLRDKRMPMAKRRARLAKRRSVGRQPRYYTPGGDPTTQAQTQVAGAGGLVSRPTVQAQIGLQAQRSTLGRAAGGTPGLNLDGHIADAVAQLNDTSLTPENARMVATEIAGKVATEVANRVLEQVTARLGQGGGPGQAALPESAPVGRAEQPARLDNWGVPRAQDRDLGGVRHEVVKAPSQDSTEEVGAGAQAAAELDAGLPIAKDHVQLRSLPELLASVNWKDLSSAERAALRTLNWNLATWNARNNDRANWPVEMQTAFMSLNPRKRQAVERLGYDARKWDYRVLEGKMGKNA